MTLYEMKKKILSMIEELNPESELLTDDPDISAKINSVINQVMFELCRMKKIPKYLEQAVNKGETIDFHGLSAACGREVYQLDMVRGVAYEAKASGTVLKFLEDGNAEIDLFVYRNRSQRTPKTKCMSLISARMLWRSCPTVLREIFSRAMCPATTAESIPTGMRP